jgi:ribosomal subunit interface protein
MQITVSGKQVELSDALRTHVARGLEGMKAKYFEHAQEAQVTFHRARAFFGCDIRIHPGRELVMHASAEAPTAHAAFDAAAMAVAKQLRRFRRRRNEHGRAVAARGRDAALRQQD